MVDGLSTKQMGWMNAYIEKIDLPISGQGSGNVNRSIYKLKN